MRKILIYTALTFLLCSCHESEQKSADAEQKPFSQPQQNGSVLLDHMASAAAAGAAGGAAAGASHAATHHAIESWKQRRAAKNSPRRNIFINRGVRKR